MDGWGLNPGTFQAAGGVATALAFIWVIISSQAARRSAKAAADATALAVRDAALRSRPWVGVTNTQLLAADDSDASKVDMIIEYKNVGLLPAEQQTITAVATTPGDNRAEVKFALSSVGSINLPNEPGVLRLHSASHHTLMDWISRGFRIDIEGRFSFQQGPQSYLTVFSAAFLFADPNNTRTGPWRNLEAS